MDASAFAEAAREISSWTVERAGLIPAAAQALAAFDWEAFAKDANLAQAVTEPPAFIEEVLGNLDSFGAPAALPGPVFAMVLTAALRVFLQQASEAVMANAPKGATEHDRPLRCPVCGGALMPLGTSLRCPQGHSYDMAKEGYVNLLAIQRRHAADPGDGKAMVRARRAFLQAGYYAPFQKALAELCLEYAPECGETHLLDAGCGEGSYDRVVYDAFAAQGRPCVLAGFDLSKDAIRLAAKLLPEAAFAVGGSFSAPVRDGWADVLLNIFSPFAEQEFCRVLRSGGVLLYAVPTARHLYGLKEVLYDEPYENAEQQTEYSGFTLIGERTVTDTITVEGDQIRNLFAMTPYFWKTPHVGALRLAAKQSLTTEIGFRFLAYRRV